LNGSEWPRRVRFHAAERAAYALASTLLTKAKQQRRALAAFRKTGWMSFGLKSK